MTEREEIIRILNTPVIHLRLKSNQDSNIYDVIAGFLLEVGVRIPVLCKDCKYRKEPENRFCNPYCTKHLSMQAKDDDFCSYGERKTNEQT